MPNSYMGMKKTLIFTFSSEWNLFPMEYLGNITAMTNLQINNIYLNTEDIHVNNQIIYFYYFSNIRS